MASPDSQNPQSNPEPTILRRFASLIGLLGASLFFTGWIYRSVYFFHFNIEVTTLDLPVQSFFIVPIQVLFGDGRAIARTLLALILMIPTLYLSLLGVRVFGDWFASRYSSFQNWVKQKPSQGFWMRGYQLIIEFDPLNFDSIKFLSSLVDESVIVAWVLFARARWLDLFNLNRSDNGKSDGISSGGGGAKKYVWRPIDDSVSYILRRI